MKAIRVHEFGGPEVLKYEDVPMPQPKAGEALMRIEAIGVNFADILMRRGLYPSTQQPPFVLGLEAAGTIAELGPGVQGWKVGDRVTALLNKSYAEYATSAANQLIRIPPQMSFEHAAAFLLQGLTAYHLLHTVGHLKKGEKVLIHAAAGGVGLLAVQLAKLAGATVYGTASSSEKLAKIKELGADAEINYEQGDFAEEIRTLTGNHGVDLILDSVGAKTFSRNFMCLAPLGRVVSFGMASGLPQTPNPLELFSKSLTISAFSLATMIQLPERLKVSLSALLEYILAGKLKLTISKTFPLEQAAEAHKYIESRQSFGKVLLRPKGSN